MNKPQSFVYLLFGFIGTALDSVAVWAAGVNDPLAMLAGLAFLLGWIVGPLVFFWTIANVAPGAER